MQAKDICQEIKVERRICTGHSQRPLIEMIMHKNKLELLFDCLEILTKRISVKELEQLLLKIDLRLEDVSDYVRFSDETYLRNLIRGGDQYHALVMCWRSGQRSPIHNHAGSTCGLRVLRGVATETVFEKTPSSLVKAVSSHDRGCGDVSVSQDANIHQVSNLQVASEDLITLHIYSPPLLRMDTYSLTNPRIGEFRPTVVEHALGSGI